MSAPHRQSVLERIARKPHTDVFDFATLLQGYGIALRFGHDASLTLGSADALGVTFDASSQGASLFSAHAGLLGAASPLPQETSTALQEAICEDGGSDLREWLALVHHTLHELLHRGVRDSLPSSCATTDCSDACSEHLLHGSAYAAGLAPVQRLAARPVLSKASCTGDDVCWALGTVLRTFGLTTSVTCLPLTGGMQPLGATAFFALGTRCHALADSAVLGNAAAAPAAGMTVTLGPVDRAWLGRCTANVDAVAHAIWAMLAATMPLQVEIDVVLLMHRDNVSAWHLGDGGPSSREGAQPRYPLHGLGVYTFLGPQRAHQSVPWPVRPRATFCDEIWSFT